MAAQKREEETQPPILEPKGKQRRVHRIRSRLFFLLPHGTVSWVVNAQQGTNLQFTIVIAQESIV